MSSRTRSLAANHFLAGEFGPMLLGRLIYTPFVRVPCLFSSGPSFGVQLPSLDLAPTLPAMFFFLLLHHLTHYSLRAALSLTFDPSPAPPAAHPPSLCRFSRSGLLRTISDGAISAIDAATTTVRSF